MRGKIALLAAAIAVVGSNSLALSPISAVVARDLGGVAPADVMLAAAGYGLATAVSGVLIAPAADRFGASRALVASLALLSAALAATAFAQDLPGLILAQSLGGLAAGALIPSVYSLAAQVAAPGRETAVTGYVLTGWTVSMAIGVFAIGLAAELASWRAAIAALASLASVLALAVAGSGGWNDAPSRGKRRSLATVLATPGLAVGLAMVAGFMMAFYGAYSFVGAHVAERLGLGADFAGLIGLAYGVGFGFAAVFDGSLTPRMAAPIYLSITMVYLALSVAAIDATTLLAAALIWGFANHLGMTLLVARLTALDPAKRGAIMGLYSAVTYFSVTLGAIAYRPLYDAHGFAACALVSAAFVLGAAALSAPRRPTGAV